MKKRLLILSLLAVCISLCIGGTMAYFTATGKATNVITSGNIKIELEETDGEGQPFRDVSNILPGMEVDKIVNVKNTGDNACWVRVKVNKDIRLATAATPDTPDPSLVTIDFNTTEWTEKDGFYYYNEKLEPGAMTKAPLFKKVSFDKTMDNRYRNSKANIIVTAQAVQTDNNGSSVLEANGWPAL